MAVKTKNIGYIWAALATPAVILVMMYGENLSRALVAATGLTISPRFSGGEITRTVDHGRYRTSIRRPVFDGLTGDRKDGFIQLDWEPAASLPGILREELDIYGNAEKFLVILNTGDGTARCENEPLYVTKDLKVSRSGSGWTVRIGLTKKRNEKDRKKT